MLMKPLKHIIRTIFLRETKKQKLKMRLREEEKRRRYEKVNRKQLD